MQSKINESAGETSQGLLNRLIDCLPIDTEESNAITRQIVEILQLYSNEGKSMNRTDNFR